MTGLKSLVLLVCIVLELVGFAIFLRGFLVLKSVVPGHALITDQPANPGNITDDNTSDIRASPHFDKLVIIVIDALRSDFILNDKDSNLPKMNTISTMIDQGHSLSFLAQSHPPTVTLPRIKALTTGGVPGFVDIVLNFDSKQLQEDNIISQMRRAEMQLVFYGDDTWMRLFPNHFKRQDGTTSFFVTDYTEVDNNVTRHLDTELVSQDWDVMILHYLGLDHIGHLAGPRSPLVPNKLQEMDYIIKRIYDAIVTQDEKRDGSSLIVVCGDHGMSDQGSHGGSSHYEISTPLILLSKYFINNGVHYNETQVQQVDLVPTLSLMLGLPIPRNNLGVIIKLVLMQSWKTTQERLQALHINAQQLSKVFEHNIHKFENEPGYLELQRAINNHRNWLSYKAEGSIAVDVVKLGEKVISQYYSALHQMRDKLTSTRVSYDIHAMGFGITILWLVLMAVSYSTLQGESDIDLSFAPTGLLTFVSMLGLLTSAHVLECTSNRGSPMLCSTEYLSLTVTSLLMLTASFWITVLVSRLFFMGYGTSLKMFIPESVMGKWLWSATVFHTVSLLGSSFVEEEHQTCYFITMTSFLILLLQHLITSSCNIEDDQDDTMMGSRMARLHQTIYCKRSHEETELRAALLQLKQQLSVEAYTARVAQRRIELVMKMKPVIGWVAAAAGLARVMRAWNRTGDKWSHLPDIGDWLVRPENKTILSLTCIIAVGVLVVNNFLRRSKTASCALFTIGSIMVYIFRAANAAVILPFTSSQVTKGVMEARIVYGIICILIVNAIWSFYRYKRPALSQPSSAFQSSATQDKQHSHPNSVNAKDFSSLPSLALLLDDLQPALQLLMLLLMRPHNIPLAAMNFVLADIVGHITVLTSISHYDMLLLYYWFGQAAFFYQGNSNSIATVDVSAGYIGLEDYQPVIIGILMCLNTYAGPIYWLLAFMVQWTKSNISLNVNTVRQRLLSTSCRLWLIRALPLAFYPVLVTIQRYHLFVWTVFSPKLLYEGMFTVVMAIIVLSMLFLQNTVYRI